MRVGGGRLPTNVINTDYAMPCKAPYCIPCRLGVCPSCNCCTDRERLLNSPAFWEMLSLQKIDHFPTGATRDSDLGKLDYEGFLSPTCLERYAQYMDKHRNMPDGSRRESDNWQLGMPEERCMKSLWRHFMQVWKAHRSGIDTWEPEKPQDPQDIQEAICACIFNLFAMLDGRLKASQGPKVLECPTNGCRCSEWAKGGGNET